MTQPLALAVGGVIQDDALIETLTYGAVGMVRPKGLA